MPKIDRSIYGTALSTALAIAGPALYAVLARYVFGNGLPDLFGLLTIGFLFLIPIALGALTVFLASPAMRAAWWFAVCGPLLPALAFVAAAGLAAWEAWICIVMAAPLFMAGAAAGGVAAFVVFKVLDVSKKTPTAFMIAVLAAPYVFTPLENLTAQPEMIRVVESSILVEADAETMWQHMIRLSEIQEAEHPRSAFHLLGLPRPVRADLSRAGVGGVRYGQWEDGLAFPGAITEWTPGRSFTVQLEADTSRVNSPLPLRAIGGPHFGMIDDSYRIEPAGEGQVIVHLYSTYRVATRFNFYSALWLDFLLRDIQSHILHILKARAEAEG